MRQAARDEMKPGLRQTISEAVSSLSVDEKV